MQAGRLPSAPFADTRPDQSDEGMSRQPGPGYPPDAYSRSGHREPPIYHREDTRAPVSTDFSGRSRTAMDTSAAASYPVGRSLQQSSGPPFGTMNTEAGDMDILEPWRGAAAAAATATQAAGRRTCNRESPPYAVAGKGLGHAGQSLPQPASREASPPYALHEEHMPAHPPSRPAQAGGILHDSRESSQGRHGDESVLAGENGPARVAKGRVRGAHESATLSADEERDESPDPSSPRHSISSLRPYANDASLQVCPSAPAHDHIVLTCCG